MDTPASPLVMPSEEVHRGVLDVLVAYAAPRSQTLAELLDYLPGAYPGDVITALDRLAVLHLVDAETRARLTRDPGQASTTASTADAAEAGEVREAWELVLPDPHPLDFDWRWGQRTAAQLLMHCLRLSRAGDTIALLGTPTLLHAAAASPQPRRWVLLEASPATTAALAKIAPGDVVRCDLARDELPFLDARVVVADPPWYPEHARVFLWAAAQLTRAGARILLAQPAVATRPGVLAERADVLAFARATGLEPVRIHSSALAYSCPPFERRALEASGLASVVPQTWRRGDLIELRRTAAQPAPRPTLDDGEVWKEVVLAGARIRFRLDRPTPQGLPADPRLQQLVDGDVLATVSRRDPMRHHVSVWTGGNRVFGCHSPDLLAILAAALAGGYSTTHAAEAHLGRLPSAPESDAIAQAIDQLTELARVEAPISHIAAATATTIGGLHDQPVGGHPNDPNAARSAS